MSQIAQKIISESEAQKRYPLRLHHPHFKPAAVSKGHAGEHGSHDMYPDKWVYNMSQEQYFASMGYVPPGTSDPEKYRREVCMLEVKAVDNDYPRALYRLTSVGKIDTALANTKADHERLAKDGWQVSMDEAKSAATKKVVALAPEPVPEPVAQQPATEPKAKRTMSAETRAKIAAGVRKAKLKE